MAPKNRLEPLDGAGVYSQGDRVTTGRELDLAIDGDGYFQIETAGGETAYTRDGSFQLDRDGNLVTRQGNLLVPNIAVPIVATISSNSSYREDSNSF